MSLSIYKQIPGDCHYKSPTGLELDLQGGPGSRGMDTARARVSLEV